MTNVDDSIRARIHAAAEKRRKAKRQRRELAQARQCGLAARRAAKLWRQDNDGQTAA